MNRTLLFVSQDERLLRSWSRWFSDDFSVLLVDNAYDALEFLQNKTIDLIVSELQLKDMDGSELLQLSAIQFPKTMRVLVAEACEEKNVREFMASGAVQQFANNAWDKDHLTSIVYGLTRTRPKHLKASEKGSLQPGAKISLNERAIQQMPAIMLLDKDQSHKNPIRLQCKEYKLRTYCISNFNYAKETVELRPEIGLVIVSVDGDAEEAISVIERIKAREKPIVIVCLLDDMTFHYASMRFVNNENVYRCYSRPLPEADIESMIKSGLRQSLKLTRMAALNPPKEAPVSEGRIQKIRNIFSKTA